MILTTGRFQTYRPEMGRAIRTTVGPPRFFKHPHVHARRCTPYGIFGVVHDEADYTAAYLARLDRHGDGVLAEIADLTDGEGGCLLCYCKLDETYCHRRILAEWVESTSGLAVPEVDPLAPARSPAVDPHRLLVDRQRGAVSSPGGCAETMGDIVPATLLVRGATDSSSHP
jgi:hypothetical protein